MDRDDLARLSKEELVEAYLALQSRMQRPTKTSRTSSRPPSSDKKEKRKNSKPGGAKPGHKGHHRALHENPDETTDYRPDRCSGCGHVFAKDTDGEVIGEYDAIDLPVIAPIVERHRRFSCLCPHCGARTKAPLPKAATGSPFGPNIATLAFYMKHFQHVSYQRLEAIFADVCGLKISQGALGNMFQRGSAAFAAQKADILTRLRQAKAVASDETGVRIEGVNAYQWVFRSSDVVLHEAAFSRGAQVVRDVMGGHRPRFWTSDRYSAQQNHADHHQTCLAHLARDIARVMEVGNEAIGLRLKLWIDDVFILWRGLRTFAASTVLRKRRQLDNRIADILCTSTPCDETRAVLQKIANARDQLFTFVDAPDLVEPTNNACEQALRPSVINRKVTNGFRAEWAANNDAAIRTTVDTARLSGQNPYSVIRQTILT
ncbi:MAG: IS66 family transposase [Gammaproteobacteria bacterium]|nr:IS66 family transposase [Gammaproteobacteria bacterium]